MDGQPNLQQLLSSILSSQLRPGDKFYLVVVPDGERPQVREFDTLAQLVEELRNLEGQPVSVVPFCGLRFRLSRGPWRHLVTPFGSVPLFTPPNPAALETDEVGYLGEEAEADLSLVQEPPPGLRADEGDVDEESDVEEPDNDFSGEEIFGEP